MEKLKPIMELLANYDNSVMVHPKEGVNNVLGQLVQEHGTPKTHYYVSSYGKYVVTFNWNVDKMWLSVFGEYDTEAQAAEAIAHWTAEAERV